MRPVSRRWRGAAVSGAARLAVHVVDQWARTDDGALPSVWRIEDHGGSVVTTWLKQGKPYTEVPAELVQPGDAFLIGGAVVVDVAVILGRVGITTTDPDPRPLSYEVGAHLTVRGRHPERGQVRT